MSTQENPQQEEVQGEKQMYFFHSTPEKQQTYRQYSAGGYVDRTTDTNEPIAVVSYAVCSERDKFSKEKSRFITHGRLEKGQKIHVLSITEEQFLHPARTIRDLAIRYVPASTLPKEHHQQFVDYHNANLKEGNTPIVRAAQVLIEINPPQNLEEIQSATTLGQVIQAATKAEVAQA